MKSTSNDVTDTTEQPIKRKRGRPRKNPNDLSVRQPKLPKLTLAEKQAIKLKKQREKQAAKSEDGNIEPKNKDRFYCTNKELQAELIKWRDSNLEEEKQVLAAGGTIDYTKRTISEELGKMLMMIGHKLLNHSNFRNYSKELKEDMLSFFYLKIIKGLKNYNFNFNNPFAFITMAAFNSFLSIINKHYKHLNIKKELMKKMASELETYTGISPNTSLNKCIKAYIGDDAELDI